MANCDNSRLRLRNLLDDVEAIKRACSEDKNCPFREFEYSDFVFKFEYHKKNVKHYYWVNLCEDYPNSSTLTCTVNGSNEHYTKSFDLALPFVFNSIARDMYKEIPIPVVLSHTSTLKAEDDEHLFDDDEDDDEDEYCDHGMDESDFFEEEKNLCMMIDQDSNSRVHEELLSDFDCLKSFCDNAKMNQIHGINEVDILMSISTDFLDDELARAWNLQPKQPIFIWTCFSLSHYTGNLGMTKVDVYQELPKAVNAEKLHPGVAIQLRSILQKFIREKDYHGISKAVKKLPERESRNTAKMKVSVFQEKSDPKAPPNPDYGFLVEILTYAQQRLHTLNNYCVICDELHTFTNANMLKPMVCTRPLCVFSFQTLGVMSTVADTIATECEVVDLLVTMAKAACFSVRNAIIFDPFPTIVDPRRSTELAFASQTEKFSQVKRVMSNFLPVEDMIKVKPAELKSKLNKKDVLIYPLLQWIISSNRSHIVKLNKDKQLDFMKTQHQFLLRSSPPAKEVAFNVAKEKYGSIFAFHGSRVENWHSILRKGLINASGTKLQVNGAAFGNGIYLSPNASMSFTYSCSIHTKCRTKQGKELPVASSESLQFLPSENIICIALCEVVNSESLKKSGSIWVMPEEDYVVTRFLFVYENAQQVDAKLQSTDPGVLSQIQKALKK